MSKQEELYTNDLFTNPMVRAAKASMTPEQIEEYKSIGESMYGDVNFETSQAFNTDNPMAEAGAYIMEGLKSGMHPDYLDEDEVKVMEDIYGKEWKNKFI